ncbi:MAG: hypothetical protein KGV51_08805 [Moraxellaceae bacterium]|nr:hypothetical protein [Moraxellaceae bacterium]
MLNKIKIFVITIPILLSACITNSVDNKIQLPQKTIELQEAKPFVPNPPIIKDFVPKPIIKKSAVTKDNPVHYAKFFTYTDIKEEITPDIGILAQLIEEDGCLLISGVEVPVFPHKTTKWNAKTQTFTWGRGHKATIGKTISYKPSDFVGKNTEEFKLAKAKFVQKANPKCLENRDLVILR